MNFLKKNWIALLLVILTIASETMHMLFVGMPFNSTVDYDSPVYFLMNQFGGSSFIVSVIVFMLTPINKVASRLILAGLIFWNIKELKDEVCYILKLNNDVLIYDYWFWMQVSFISTIVLVSFFWNTKYNC